MLYVIGLGLSDEKDITVKGLEVGHASLHVDRLYVDCKHRICILSGSEEMRKSVSRSLYQYPYGLKGATGECSRWPASRSAFR